MLLYPMERAREVLRFYRDWAAAAPNELATMALLRVARQRRSCPRASTANRWSASPPATAGRWRRASG
jgi:hypothetical protein